jgi:hypothetical protein
MVLSKERAYIPVPAITATLVEVEASRVVIRQEALRSMSL